jgi:nucleoside-diphosphate-sugar epimerase
LHRKTILVTGAGGFAGGELAQHFARQGHRVLAGYRNTPLWVDALPNLVAVRMDLAEGVPIDEPVQVIVHAAAHTHLDPHARARDYARSNVMGTAALAEFARTHDTRVIVHLSTVSVYGEVHGPAIAANTPFDHPGLYGATKYLAELILADHVNSFASVSLRLPGVVGRSYFTPWLGRLLSRALSDEPIEAYNPLALFNNVVDTNELARCVEYLIGSEIRGSHTAALAASDPVSINQVVSAVVRFADSRSVVRWQSGRRKSFTIDVGGIRELGFHPVSTMAIIERYVKTNLDMKCFQQQ